MWDESKRADMGTREPDRTLPIQATDNTFRILEELRDRNGAGVTELADALGVSKSTVHDHLATLRELGYVRSEGTEYTLSPLLLSFGGTARQSDELYSFARDEVDALARETGETAKVITEEYGKGVYLYQSHGSEAVHTDAHVGTIVHLHATAAGKAILAHLPQERIERIIDRHGLPERTDNTITDETELFERLESIRNRGVAFDDGERIDGIRCVAAPIQRDGEVIGGLSVSGPTRRITEDQLTEEFADLVQDTARVVEINATYSTPPS